MLAKFICKDKELCVIIQSLNQKGTSKIKWKQMIYFAGFSIYLPPTLTLYNAILQAVTLFKL